MSRRFKRLVKKSLFINFKKILMKIGSFKEFLNIRSRKMFAATHVYLFKTFFARINHHFKIRQSYGRHKILNAWFRNKRELYTIGSKKVYFANIIFATIPSPAIPTIN